MYLISGFCWSRSFALDLYANCMQILIYEHIGCQGCFRYTSRFDKKRRLQGSYLPRRWRHKETGSTISRDLSFIAEGSRFTKEVAAFFKELRGE